MPTFFAEHRGPQDTVRPKPWFLVLVLDGPVNGNAPFLAPRCRSVHLHDVNQQGGFLFLDPLLLLQKKL